jgi:osmotically-inducible protein OsmY
VASAAELTRARDGARAAGVEMVDASPLSVERWSRDKELRRGKYGPISPQELQQAARQMLARDGHVAGFAVSVEAEDGSLVLRGTVGNLFARRAAERTLRHLVGAGPIVNRIKVRPAETAEDTVVAADIRQALRRDPYLWALPLQVAAAGGVARLTGSADNYFQKARADDLAAQARGIVAVSNQIEVLADARAFVASPYLDDADARDFPWYTLPPRQAGQEDQRITVAITERLRWSPYVNAEAVKVAVRSGVVTLTGTVGCQMQKLTAEHNAYAGGAAAVVNELKVE